MQSITTIGLDIAKSVFQVHGVDAAGQVVVRRQLRRRHVLAFFEKLPPSLVGIEACASSHHWSRELHALGHTVRLMPPAYVKPTSSGRRTTSPTRRRFAKRSRGQACGSCRPRRASNRLV
jgi:transposase